MTVKNKRNDSLADTNKLISLDGTGSIKTYIDILCAGTRIRLPLNLDLFLLLLSASLGAVRPGRNYHVSYSSLRHHLIFVTGSFAWNNNATGMSRRREGDRKIMSGNGKQLWVRKIEEISLK